jgi:hypothetical protein
MNRQVYYQKRKDVCFTISFDVMIYLSSEGHEHRQYDGEQQYIVTIGVSMVQDFNLPSPIALRGLGSYIAAMLRHRGDVNVTQFGSMRLCSP